MLCGTKCQSAGGFPRQKGSCVSASYVVSFCLRPPPTHTLQRMFWLAPHMSWRSRLCHLLCASLHAGFGRHYKYTPRSPRTTIAQYSENTKTGAGKSPQQSCFLVPGAFRRVPMRLKDRSSGSNAARVTLHRFAAFGM